MKAKCLILIMVLMLVTISLVQAGEKCEDILTPGQKCQFFTPVIYCTQNATVYNLTEFVEEINMTLIGEGKYYLNFSQSEGSYEITLCDNSTREILVEGEDEMAGLAIMIFVLAIAIGLFILPFKVKSFSKIYITNIIIRRGCWAVAIYLMMLNSAIAATIAENAGLDLTQEMFRYMWFFGIAGYVTLVILGVSTIFNIIRHWNAKKSFERDNEGMGFVEDETDDKQ